MIKSQRITFAIALVTLATSAQALLSSAAAPTLNVRGIEPPAGGGGFLLGADNCETPHTVLPTGVSADNPFATGTTGTTGQTEALCNEFGTTGITNDVWFEWTADAIAGYTTLRTCGASTIDTKIAVYPSGGGGSSTCPPAGTAIACIDDACGLQTCITWSHTAGGTYTIQIGTFPGAMGGSGTFDIESTLTGCGDTGTPLCFGDSSGTACLCGNGDMGTGGGCPNAAPMPAGQGAILSASGTNSASADNLLLIADFTTNQPGLFFQGNNAIGGGTGITFGDGIRCCGGSVVRLEIADPPGTAGPKTANTTQPILGTSPPSTTTPGDTRCYQWWYRNPGTSLCGSNFNLSNAMLVTWRL